MRLRSLLVLLVVAGAAVASFSSQSRLLAAPPDATNQTVMLSLKVFEIDRSRLRSIGFDLAPSAEQPQSQPFALPQTLEPSSALPDLLDFLTSKKLAKVLASPNICVAVANPIRPNTPAVFRVGGMRKVRLQLEGKEVVEERLVEGTQVECSIPAVHANGDLQIELKLRLASFVASPTETVVYPDGSLLNPRLKTFDVNSGFQLTPGHTRVLDGLCTLEKDSNGSDSTAHEVVRLVLITAQKIEVADAAAPRVARSPSGIKRSDDTFQRPRD